MTGKLLIILGIILILAGFFIRSSGKIPFLGKLPGDISIERDDFKFYFPITSCILISILISIVVFVINRSKN